MNPGYVPPYPGAPSPGEGPPAAIGYARMYAGAFTLMYVLCVLGGGAILTMGILGIGMSRRHDAVESIVRGVAMVIVGIPLAILSAMAFFGIEKRTKTMYTMHLVLHALGCMSCCCLPMAVPMLLQWLKPDVKAWYGA